MQKTFTRKQQIDNFLKFLDRPSTNGYEPDNIESSNLPNFGSDVSLTFKKYLPNYDKKKLSGRQQYFLKLKNEAKKCQLCGLETKYPENLVIDHEHSSRKIRGVLCQNCNSGLGKFLDSIKLLKKAIKYLKEFETKRDQAQDYFRLRS